MIVATSLHFVLSLSMNSNRTASDKGQLNASRKRTYSEVEGSPESTELLEAMEDNGVPVYDAERKAADFFADIYFYCEKEPLVEIFKEKRLTAFQDKTVEELLQPIQSHEALWKALSGTGVNAAFVEPYWKESRKTPESRLRNQLILTGIDIDEADSIQRHYVGIHNYELRHCADNEASQQRKHDFHIVVGSSGTGKTSLALNKLGKGDDDQWFFTVYFALREGIEHLDELKQRLQKDILRQLHDKLESYEHKGPLQMQMVLIIDKAYKYQNAIHSVASLRSVQECMEEHFAQKVKLVVVGGTGYETVANRFDSKNDVYMYRMKSWKVDDVVKVARSNHDDDLADNIAISLQKHPVLASFATNARAASLMMDKIPACNYLAIAQEDRVECVLPIVEYVAQIYICYNRLTILHDNKDKRLAARMVLIELEKSWRNKRHGRVEAPVFDHCNDLWVRLAAMVLIDHNYERVGTELELIDGELAAITVSPSIALILFYLLGAAPQLYDGWTSLESTLALFLLRQAVMNEEDPDKLERYGVVNFRLPVPAPGTIRTFSVPKLRREMVWVNGPRAPIGDVITDHTIGRVKHTLAGESAELDLGEEMVKMGFMKEECLAGEELEAARLRTAIHVALVHTWSVLDRDQQATRVIDPPAVDLVENRQETHGQMYPEEVFVGEQHSPIEDITCCVSYDAKQVVVGDEAVSLDECIGDWKVVFATNGDRFRISLSGNNTTMTTDSVLELGPDDVNENGETSNLVVQEWIKENVVDNAKVLFCFAAPAW